MVTTTTDRAEVFSRPSARFDDDGNIEVRASSALGCRRALWYAATNYQPTNPPSEESLTAMEAGNALEPVVVRAMERAGWKVDAPDPQEPQQVTVRVGPNMLVTGHPDGTVRMPIDGDEAAAPQLFLFDEEPEAPAYGDPMGRRDQDAGAGGVPSLADAGRRAQPPGVGGPGRLLHAGHLRRPAGRGDRHDGHGQPHLGLGVDTRATGWSGPSRRPASGSASWRRTTSRTGLTPTHCPSATSPQPAGNAEAARSWRSAYRERLRPSKRRQRQRR